MTTTISRLKGQAVSTNTLETLTRRAPKEEVRRLIGRAMDDIYRRRFGTEQPWMLVPRLRGTGALRMLTNPGLWDSEVLWMEEFSRLARHTEEVVGLEHSTSGAVEALTATRASEFSRRFGIKTTMVMGCDRVVLAGGFRNRLTEKAALTSGFDLVWLDYCGALRPEVLLGLGQWVQRVHVFDRAWRRERPGLFWVTLQMGRETGVSMQELDRALTLSEPRKAIPQDAAERRWRGLTAWLNHQASVKDVTFLPRQFCYYKADANSAQMLVCGFEVYPVWIDRWQTIADPQVWRHDP